MSSGNGYVAPPTVARFSTSAVVVIEEIVIAVIDAAKGPAASSYAKPTANISKALKAGSTTVTINKHTGNVSGTTA
jgi:hypothetical protein